MKVIVCGGKLDGIYESVEDLEYKALRFNMLGKRTPKDYGRKELQEQITLIGYLGPMWDGDKIRFETKEVYEHLSN